jgi:hypothetical protein
MQKYMLLKIDVLGISLSSKDFGTLLDYADKNCKHENWQIIRLKKCGEVVDFSVIASHGKEIA